MHGFGLGRAARSNGRVFAFRSFWGFSHRFRMNMKPINRVALLFALFAAPSAVAAPVIVADVDSGKVIYAQQATEPWYPASVTKLMTAYVVFKAVDTGKISFDTPFTMSERALAQPPSKIAVKVGLQVTVDNAMKMLMVKSA